MQFFMYFAFVACLGAFFDICAAQEGSRKIHIAPGSRSHSMTIREFHECVSCNDDAQARTDFDACLSGLSPRNQEIMRQCCESTFDKEFCEEVASGKTNYAAICKIPRKGLEVERCFWKTTNKDGADIEPFRQCKKQILVDHCTSQSGDMF